MNLAQFRAEGIRASIDDFGAGYTSLALLRMLPVTALKIDGSLVTHMLDFDQDEAVTQAVIELAHRLDLDVIAEGVEDEALSTGSPPWVATRRRAISSAGRYPRRLARRAAHRLPPATP